MYNARDPVTYEKTKTKKKKTVASSTPHHDPNAAEEDTAADCVVSDAVGRYATPFYP